MGGGHLQEVVTMTELTVTSMLLPDYFYNSAIWPKQDSVVWFQTDVFKFFVVDSVEVKPAVTRKLRRRPNDPLPAPEKRRKTSHILFNYHKTRQSIVFKAK